MKAFTFRKKGHYKGICSLDDIGPDTHKWLLDIHGPGDAEHLTFANVLINSNYRRYVDEMLPLYKERDIIYVVNESADLTELPFKVKKDFRVGTNCIVNNIQGWKVNRGYLTHYWLKSGSPYGDRVDYWHDDKNKPNQNTTPILA